MSSWNARNSSGVALSGECPKNPVKSRIARKYIVWVFGCSPLIRISSRKRRRSGGICCSDIETSCRQIEKASIVRQVGQFAKSMQFTSARNTHHKHQYRESGFVLVRRTVVATERGERPLPAVFANHRPHISWTRCLSQGP